MEHINKQFDVIISGGGLSGSLMALSLSELTKADGSSLSIAIIEASDNRKTSQNDPDALFDNRVLALSHGSARYLEQVGAWSFLQQDACPIKDIDISDRGHFAKARLNAQSYGVDALGYVIDMALIGKAQLTALASKSNVHWFSPDSIENIEWQPKHVEVALSSGQQLHGQLLLACDGAHSPCRKLAKIDVRCDDYEQVAVIANVATEFEHNNKAFERFTENGPIAMLPLHASKGSHAHQRQNNHTLGNMEGKGRCSLVWTMLPEQAERINKLSDKQFAFELEAAFGRWLGKITQVGKRDVYPLVLLQAKQQTYHRMALIGNASHTIHPIAGQGFNLGLRDVQYMATLIRDALADDTSKGLMSHDVGNFALLQQYQKSRTEDQQAVIQLTDSLVTLFANDIGPLVIGRNIGLQLLNAVPPFKNALVKKTMGY